MKGTRHSEEQIIAILKQGEAGLTTAELCRQHGITEQTYYRWKAKYGGMESGGAKKMKQLEDENRKLKHVVAELTLDNRALMCSQKTGSACGTSGSRSYVEVGYQMRERHACRLLGLGRSTHRYQARKAERDDALRTRLKELAAQRMRFGYRRLTAMLLREGTPANHKRVYRLYREEGLAMRIRQRRRICWNGAVTRPAAMRPNERWSMDFVSDCVSSGKVIRMLTIVDDCTRECPVIEVDTSLGGLRVRRVLDRMASERGLPEAICGQRTGVSRTGLAEIGQRIRKIRGQILQEELCGYLNVTQGHLSKIERGKIAPSLEMLILLSDRFHKSIDWILRGEGS